ncbi:RNA polymerase sigma factor [Clostridium sp. MB05]|jgi:RNA polymerase sigma-70 factor, ECF subfamily|uniref:RNA polymerase sigma factor n=1 Tax=Clostridium sp. MB05 TaxID=3376682 RepID=UPI003982CDEB
MDEKLLIKKAKKGNKEAFIELLKTYEKDVYLFAKYMLNNDELVRDAVQETITVVYEKISTLKNDNSFKSWLLKILGNKCRDLLKREKNVTYLDSQIEEQYIDNGFAEIEIRQCMDGLSDEHKKIIILYYFNDLSYKEISDLMEISEGTVKSKLSRAKESLKKIISKEEMIINETRRNVK